MNDFQTFITSYIGSIEQLEILLLLKNSSERSWTAAEISAHLRGNRDSVLARLQGLVNNGLATRIENQGDARFKYCAPSPSMDQQVEQLRDTYAQKRTTVINMIYTGTSRAESHSAVQELANAFKIKRGPS
jgi:DNA-binding MarR family transcriptional regulator